MLPSVSDVKVVTGGYGVLRGVNGGYGGYRKSHGVTTGYEELRGLYRIVNRARYPRPKTSITSRVPDLLVTYYLVIPGRTFA